MTTPKNRIKNLTAKNKELQEKLDMIDFIYNGWKTTPSIQRGEILKILAGKELNPILSDVYNAYRETKK